MKRTGQIPFFAGAAVCLLIRAMPLKGLSSPGVWCLGLTLMTVIWWAAQVAQPGYISGTYLMLLCLLSGSVVILCSILARIIGERMDPRLGEAEGWEAAEYE